MRFKFLFILTCACNFHDCVSQNVHSTLKEQKGVIFVENMSWQQVKERAKQQQKFIFVECYATWCVPCKKMEQLVFSKEIIGREINEKFISVRVQMDSTKNDSKAVKKWYREAAMFKKQFNVSSVPTYLFFLSDGEIVHRAEGYLEIEQFLSISKDAVRPESQFYSLLRDYENGIRDYLIMPFIAKTSKAIGNTELAEKIARDYKLNFIDFLPDSALLKKEIIEFMGRDFPFLIYEEGSKGRFFELFYRNEDKVDSIVNFEGFSGFFVKKIISNELSIKLNQSSYLMSKPPDWNDIAMELRQTIDSALATEIVLESEMNYYRKLRNWQKYAEMVDKQIEANTLNSQNGRTLHIDADPYKLGDAWALNAAAWEIFLYCKDTNVLSRALKWSELSITLNQENPNPQFFDTMANILYKMGNRREAIQYEEKAIEIDNRNARKQGLSQGSFYKEYCDTIRKMKNMEPTWHSD